MALFVKLFYLSVLFRFLREKSQKVLEISPAKSDTDKYGA